LCCCIYWYFQVKNCCQNPNNLTIMFRHTYWVQVHHRVHWCCSDLSLELRHSSDS
jgi:hypothetical protein